MMICFEGNGARIPLRSRDLTTFEFVRQRERITLRGACVKECVDSDILSCKLVGYVQFYLAIHAYLLADYRVRKLKCGNVKMRKDKSYAITWLWGRYIIGKCGKSKPNLKLLHPMKSYII